MSAVPTPDSDQVRDALAHLHRLVDTARALPLSSSVVLPRAELVEAMERVEAAYLSATEEARGLVAQRDDVVRTSEDEASEILRAARLEQDRLVSDTEVFRVAQREGADLVAIARDEAATLRQDTEAYVETRLANLQHALERTLTEVRRGITNLTSSEPVAPDAGDVLLAEPAAG